jgi:hypothetical protein
LALLDHLLRHTFVPRIRYLGFSTRWKKDPLTTTRDLSTCKSKRALIQLLIINTFRDWCALVALPACSGHRGFFVGIEGLPVGCTPDGPAMCFWALGRYRLETFPRSACLECLCQTLCSNAGYLGVATLQFVQMSTSSYIFIIIRFDCYTRPLHAMRFPRSC